VQAKEGAVFGKKRKWQTKVKRCSDGREIQLLHPNDLWPLKKESLSVSTKAGIDILSKVKADLGADIASQIEGMLVLLDEASSSMLMNYRAAYSTYYFEPCTEGQLEYYKSQVEKIREQENTQRSLLITLQQMKGILERDDLKGEDLREALGDVLDAVSKADEGASRKAAYSEARKEAREWKRPDVRDHDPQ